MYYLFKNETVIDKSEDFEKLLQLIIDENLHTDFYGEKLDNIEILNEYLDSHEGVYSLVDMTLNANNEYIDMFIVKEFYAYQDEKWLEEIARFNGKEE